MMGKISKAIGISEKGIEIVNEISKFELSHVNIERINKDKDVDKDFVRNLLDDIEILYLIFDSSDKRAIEIVKAIGFMASERKTLCIGFDFSTDKSKKIEEIDRYIKTEEKNIEKIADLMDMMAESITEEPILNLDITDLRDIMITDKDIKYICTNINYGTESKIAVEKIMEDIESTGDEFISRKCIIILEGDERVTFEYISELMMEFEERCNGDKSSVIFANLVKEKSEQVKVCVLFN
ncbi:hypothetical protein [Peptacetobacter sp.]|uniref:hypothetical protein n=1 Tax=Peptacetobacter sp. TaxID=2991975 RepID=UPI002631F6A4|nr:hypothetical protein [Peptacetobacter sp.]